MVIYVYTICAIYIYDNGPSMWLKRHNGLNIPPLCCWSVPINPILDSSPCCLLSTIEMQLIDVHPPWRFRAVLKTLCSALCIGRGVGGCRYLDIWNNQINSAVIALSDKIVKNYSALQMYGHEGEWCDVSVAPNKGSFLLVLVRWPWPWTRKTKVRRGGSVGS